MNETCKHGAQAPVEMLRELHDAQGGRARHKCAVCAYEQGKSDSAKSILALGSFETCPHGNIAPITLLDSLQESQAGEGRHKCAVCAYEDGRKSALAITEEHSAEHKPAYIHGHGLKVIEHLDDGPAEPDPLERMTEEERCEIGLMGEELVMRYEMHALLSVGKPELANQIVHVAVDEGDGAGYDIRSYTPEGEVKYIEVKTTLGTQNARFFLTRNEYSFGQNNAGNYYIYRLHDLIMEEATANLYIKKGNVDEHFDKSVVTYQLALK